MPQVIEHAANAETVGGAGCADGVDDLAGKLVRRLLVGVEQQHPFTAGVVERDLFLANVPGERLSEDFRAEALGDFDGAVG